MMQPVNRHPRASDLRTFAWVILCGLLVLGGLLWVAEAHRFRHDQPLARWVGAPLQYVAVGFWTVGLAAGLLTLASYPAGRVIYVVWMTAATWIGAVMTFVLLSVLFFVLLPWFTLIRLKDPLRTRLRGPGQSYWENHQHHESTLERTARPF